MTTDIQTLAGEIATALGGGWTCEEPKEEFGDYICYLRHADGYVLRLYIYRDKTRLFIAGMYPKTRDGQRVSSYSDKADPEITCAFARGSAAIAKEIERRLLPPYLEMWAEMSERARSHDAHEEGKEQAKLRIMAAVPLDFNQDTDTADFRFKNGGDFYGDVRMNGPDSVEIKIRSVALTRALEVLRVLLGPRDIAAEIVSVTARMAERQAEVDDPGSIRFSLTGEQLERFDRHHEEFLTDLRNRRAELQALAERVKGLEVTE